MDTLFIPLLERIALTISAAGVRYMVIGGQAVIQYAESRLTRSGSCVTVNRSASVLARLLALARLRGEDGCATHRQHHARCLL